MTYDEAINFFCRFGNVSKDPEVLKKVKPTEQQLNYAIIHAVTAYEQPEEFGQEAKRAIINHYNMQGT